MKLLVLIAAVACLSSVYAHGKQLEDFWRKYGAIKIMKSCLTPAGTKTWKVQLQKALDKCNTQAEGRSLSIDAVENADWDSLLGDASSSVHPRNRRSPKYTAEKIRKMKQKLSKQVENFRCVMREIRVTDANNEINTETILEQYRVLNLTATVQKDIEEAVNHCYQCIQCLPLEGRKDLPLPADVLKSKKFIECEMKLRYHACLKNDMVARVKEGYFDFKGLDGRFNKLADDETRAVAILMAEEFVGPNDYDLYE